jgi:hypothetical protein
MGLVSVVGEVNVTDRLAQRALQGLLFQHDEFSASLANESTLTLLIRAPAVAAAFPGRRARLVIDGFVGGTGVGVLQLFEGVDASADGTPRTPVNHARGNAHALSTLVFAAPTVNTDGTQLSARGLGRQAPDLEWSLQPETDYLVRLTNNSGSSVPCSIRALIYEAE